jgi:UDP-2,3-diacylglucosamine hydrolase
LRPPPPLATLYELDADPAWRSIEFVSDLHLAEGTPRTIDAFERYLAGTGADLVCVLGDLFEVWIGDDARLPGTMAARVCDALSHAAAVRRVAFMAGNRDFLVGAAMLGDCGLHALPDPTVLDAWGQRVLLSHGDRLCLADEAYQAFRARVRSDEWRRGFLAKPLAEREQLARRMRDASEANKKTTALWADVDAAAAVAWMHLAGARDLVHGHTHRPSRDTLAPGFTRHVLSDWDVDTAAPRAQVLRLTRDGFARHDLTAD